MSSCGVHAYTIKLRAVPAARSTGTISSHHRHSNAVSEVVAMAHASQSFDRENWPTSKSWVTSNDCSDMISCPMFKTKVSAFRS